jgi:quinol-cytochrome oxidoreductase complex cytochrome b subunit
VELLRGGVGVGQATLTRFYSLHTFVLPLLTTVFMLIHFLIIRKQGISGPLLPKKGCTRLYSGHRQIRRFLLNIN